MIFGIDTINKKFKIMNPKDDTKLGSKTISVSYAGNENEKSLAEIADMCLSHYVKARGAFTSNTASLVLPDRCVALDYITLPTMSKSRLNEAYNVEFRNQYPNTTELIAKNLVVQADKRSTTYQVTITRRAELEEMFRVFGHHGITLKDTTCEAFATADAALQLLPKARRQNFIFCNVAPTSCEIVIFGKERVYGFGSLPFGLNVLSGEELTDEYMMFPDDVARLAVINARELAKKTKLTSFANDDEDEDENAEDAGEEKNDEEKPEEGGEQTDSAAPKREALTRDQILEEARLAAEEEKQAMESRESERDNDGTAPAVIPVKAYVKKPRKLPVWMLPDGLETEEDYLLENFRIIQKRILLFARNCFLTDYLPDPAFALVGLPAGYSGLIDRINAEPDNKLPLRYFDTEADGVNGLSANIGLYGAYFINSHSRNFIF